MAHILVVCTANICRSPVAEALLRDRLRRRGLDDWVVSSAGTWAQPGRGASRYSTQVMREHGFDIGAHQSRMVDESHLRQADLVLCMEVGHDEALRAEFPGEAHKIYLIAEMIGQSYNVNDPYGGPYDGYERMYETMVGIVDQGLDRIIDLARKNAAARRVSAVS